MTLDELWVQYYKLGDTPLRFGQYFCNEKSITNAEIFYCEDNNEAYQLIQSKWPHHVK
jgi:hypothetical protein